MKYTIIKPPGYKKPTLPFKKEWLKALRSGRYEQGRKRLKNGNMYCCLGVLCELKGELKNDCHYECGFSISPRSNLYRHLYESGRMPKGVCVEILGIDRTTRYLSSLNDGGMSFIDIADIIDQIWD